MTKRYPAKELRGMSLISLARVGSECKPPLKFSKNVNRTERARRILQTYTAAAVTSSDSAASSHAQQLPKEAADSPRYDAKPEFEKLCSGSGDTTPETTSPTGQPEHARRGGERIGAGRPSGMTNDLAFYNRLPQQPHPVVIQILKVAFKTWASAAHSEDVALTEAEAIELALPWTQVAHLAGVLDRMPPWLFVGMCCIWTTANIVARKAGHARKAAADRKAPAKDAPVEVTP